MKALDLAIAEIGTMEWANGSNPKVVAYYRDAGHPEVKDDSVAWCAALVGAMLKRSGVKPSGKLTARSYLDWGAPVAVINIQPGDIGIIPRGASWQGHVFFIEKVVGNMVHAVGGNQNDSVSRTKYPVASLIGVRRTSLRDTIKQKDVADQMPARNSAEKPIMHQETISKPSLTPVPPKPSKAPAIGAALVALLVAVWAWITRG